MRKLIVVALVIASAVLSTPAFAVEGQEVAYVNGTVEKLKVGTVGALDTTSATSLEFRSSTSEFAIPYSGITFYQCKEASRFHLGVLPAIAVSLVKKRARVHFVTITWRGERGVPEVVTLEVSKQGFEALAALLHARAAGACKERSGQACGRVG